MEREGRALSSHVLAFVEDSARARDVTTVADEVATKMGAALTVVAVAVIEQVRPRCCDLGSGGLEPPAA